MIGNDLCDSWSKDSEMVTPQVPRTLSRNQLTRMVEVVLGFPEGSVNLPMGAAGRLIGSSDGVSPYSMELFVPVDVVVGDMLVQEAVPVTDRAESPEWAVRSVENEEHVL